MALTDHSDIYSALHEDGMDRIVGHLMRKRPSLFNYGTERLVDAAAGGRVERRSLCASVDYAPEVLKRVGQPIPADADSPLMTEQDPLPVLGTDDLVALDYCVQVTDMELDFPPEDVDGDGPVVSDDGLGPQQFAASVVVCAGLACPDDDEFDGIADRLAELREAYDDLDDPDRREALGLPIVPEPETVHCFCLRVAVVGSVELVDRGAVSPVLVIEQSPHLAIDEIRIESFEDEKFSVPGGVAASIECYLRSFVQLGLLPTLSRTLEEVIPKTLEMEFVVFDLEAARATVSLPTSEAIPNNPALEDDEFRMYVDVDLEAVGSA